MAAPSSFADLTRLGSTFWCWRATSRWPGTTRTLEERVQGRWRRSTVRSSTSRGTTRYYKASPVQVTRNLAKLTKALPEVAIPQNGTVTIAGQRFIAGTMWFRPDPAAEQGKRIMHDFSLIKDFEPWVYEENAAFEQVVDRRLEATDVVLTHHLPAPQSTPMRFARSVANAFFVCDMTSYIAERQPKLWIHGHTHDRCDYVLGKTRIVANPLGYPSEPRSLEAFEPAFQIDI